MPLHRNHVESRSRKYAARQYVSETHDHKEDVMSNPAKEDMDEFISRTSYDRATGQFIWIRPPHHSQKSGDVAGHVHPNGYRYIKINYRRYLAHRLAFYIVHGRWPSGDLDHVNGNYADNRPENLRECNDSQNRQNIGVTRANTSGYPGVTWNKRRNKWISRITHQGQLIPLGAYSSAEDAYRAYRMAKARLHTFAPNGRGLPEIDGIDEPDAPSKASAEQEGDEPTNAEG